MSPAQFDRAAQQAARNIAKVPAGRIACTVGELLSKAKEASATAANRYQANALPR